MMVKPTVITVSY